MKHHPDPPDVFARRYVLLGTGALFTANVLQTLLDAQEPPVAYLHHGPLESAKTSIAGIPIEQHNPGSALASLVRQHRINSVEQAELELSRHLAAFDADFLLVACWPELIDASSIAAVRCAALNLHPSLLPAYRGPNPINAQLQAGDHRFGVSLHLLSPQFDRGDILAQAVLPNLDRVEAAMVESTAGVVGARLFVEALRTYPDWRLRPQPA